MNYTALQTGRIGHRRTIISCTRMLEPSKTQEYCKNVSGGDRLSHQRNLANLRERKRMMLINSAFKVLLNRLPIHELQTDNTSNDQRTCRLTKVDILRLTIDYIKKLTQMLDGNATVADISTNLNAEHYDRLFRANESKQRRLRTINRPVAKISKIKKFNQELRVHRYILSWSKSARSECAPTDLRTTKLWTPELQL